MRKSLTIEVLTLCFPQVSAANISTWQIFPVGGVCTRRTFQWIVLRYIFEMAILLVCPLIDRFGKDKYLRTILGNTIQMGHKIGQNTRVRCRLPIEIKLKSNWNQIEIAECQTACVAGIPFGTVFCDFSINWFLNNKGQSIFFLLDSEHMSQCCWSM